MYQTTGRGLDDKGNDAMLDALLYISAQCHKGNIITDYGAEQAETIEEKQATLLRKRGVVE